MRVWAIVGLVACGDAANTQDECASPLLAWADADGDTFGGGEPLEVCTLSDGQVTEDGDCDDADPEVHPGADEKCDGIDNDCFGGPDQGLAASRTVYTDLDGDGFGVLYPAEFRCGPPGPGWTAHSGDCEDGDPEINPDADEVCNDLDDDCDGMVDGVDDDIDESTFLTFYEDGDGDGYGATSPQIEACDRPAGYADNDEDCADSDRDRNPGASEVCNTLDDDCDAIVDDNDPSLDTTTLTAFYDDADNDGWGSESDIVWYCSDGVGRASNNLDCDDSNAGLNLDDLDLDTWSTCEQDCDDSSALITPTDLDGDGITACAAIPDCAPTIGSIYPGAPETTADGVDQDCDGSDTCFRDLDLDGFGTPALVVGFGLACNRPGEAVVDTDCDDGDPAITEERYWYADDDGDGFGAGNTIAFGCYPPDPSASGTNDDCDALDATIWPGAPEDCADLVDQDCDGSLLCCEIMSELDAVGWPAHIDFSYCWGTMAPCAFSPPGLATWTMQLDGTYTSQGYTGDWEVDEVACELHLIYGTSPHAHYVGTLDGQTCFEGEMTTDTQSYGTWAGCID